MKVLSPLPTFGISLCFFSSFQQTAENLRREVTSDGNYLGTADRNTLLSHFEWTTYFCLFSRYLTAWLFSSEARSSNMSIYYCPELSLLCGIVHCTDIRVCSHSLLPLLGFTHIFWKKKKKKPQVIKFRYPLYHFHTRRMKTAFHIAKEHVL